MKRVISTFMLFALLIIMMPIIVQADDTTDAITHVNKLYANVLEASDLTRAEDVAVVVSEETDTIYTSVEDAGAAVREQLKDRIESVVVCIQQDSANTELAKAIFDAALEHTGDPVEGDYLAYQYAGWTCEIMVTNEDDLFQMTYHYTVTYMTTAEQEAQMDVAVNALLEELDLGRLGNYEKIKGIYDWICGNVTYDYENLEDDTYKLKHTAYAALINRSAVCQGYAVLFYRLALELGIDARLISGTGNGEPHSWNIVLQDDGYYYNLDATWDAGMSEYSWFLLNDGEFRLHDRDAEYETDEFWEKYPMLAGESPYKWSYSINSDGTIKLTGCSSELSGRIVLPSEIDGMQVTVVGKELLLRRSEITSVVVPEGVQVIEYGAFAECRAMISITLPSTLISIEYNAFEDCRALKKLVIPEGVTVIPNAMCTGCLQLESITLPDGIISIGGWAFADCQLMTAIELPESLISIGHRAFASCLSLESIHIPQNVQNLTGAAFVGCRVLHSITVSEDNGYFCVVDGVLFDINKTTLVWYPIVRTEPYTVPDGVTHIGEYAFALTNFSELTLPEGLIDIGVFAFWEANFSRVILPDSTRSIQANAFYQMCNLEYIYIPKNVEIFGGNCFKLAENSFAPITIDIDPENPHYCVVDGVVFSKDMETLLIFPYRREGTYLIPDTVKTIGNYAFFYSCLDYIKMPEKLESVGVGAFEGAEIKTVVLPESVQTIGENAFKYCDVTALYFLGDVPVVGTESLLYCELDVYYPEGNTSWESVAGNDYGAITVTWNAFVPGSEPNPITTILEWKYDGEGTLSVSHVWGNGSMTEYYGDSADYTQWDIYKDQITSVVIGEGITNINTHAFDGYENLASVSVPSTVTSIDYAAFMDCSGLKDVFITDLKSWCMVDITGINSSPIYGAETLYIDGVPTSDIVIPEDITNIKSGIFTALRGLTSVTLSESISEIGNYAFGDCYSLTSITIPEHVSSIGNGAFNRCTALEEINFNAIAVEDFEKSNYVFYDAGTCGEGITVNIGSKVTRIPENFFTSREVIEAPPYIVSIVFEEGSVCASIGSYAFYDCPTLMSIELPNSVTNIGSYAFGECSGITGITIPNSVTSIGSYAFNGCSGLTDISLGKGVLNIDSYAFSDCTALTAITIPESVTDIADYVFSGCTSLRLVTFEGDAPVFGGTNMFDGVTATAIFPEDNETWTAEVRQNYGGKITWEPYCENEEEDPDDTGKTYIASGSCGVGVTWGLDEDNILTISGMGDMTSYQSYSYVPWYNYRQQITTVLIRNSVTSISKYAFYDCEALTDVTIGKNVISIGSYAFSLCGNLSDITVGSRVESIGSYTFSGCRNLQNIVLSEGITSIGDYAFKGCRSLARVDIPEGVSVIASYTFSGCDGLESVTLPSTVTQIKAYAFNQCDSLKTINIPDGVTTIGGNAFYLCKALESVNIPSSVTSIGSNAFGYCTNLEGIFVAQENTKYSSDAYGLLFDKEKTKLIQAPGALGGSYEVPDSVVSIQNRAFAYCMDLEGVVISDSVTNIGESVFSYCTELTDAVIGNGTSGIGKESFYQCANLARVTLGTGLTSIGDQAFSGCAALTSISIPENVTKIGDLAFNGCSSLTDIVFPTSLSSIGRRAFAGCAGLTYVTIPENVVSIGQGAFQECTNLVAFYVDAKNNEYSCDKTGVLFNNEQSELIQAPCAITGDYIVPDSVTKIGSYAFYDCTKLTGITLPAGVTDIGSQTFGECTDLASITYTGDAPTIGSNAFYHVVATARYPGKNDTWSDAVMLNYGGDIRWVSSDWGAAPSVKIGNVPSSGKIKLTWNAVDGAAKYRVYRSTSKSSGYKLMKTTTGTTYINTTAKAGTLYYYYVVAVASDGTKSDKSNIVSRTCDLAQPVVKVTNVASSGKIKLTWEAVEGAVEYKVYRATSKNGEYKLMKTTTGTTYTNSTAVAGKLYYYKVVAIHTRSAANSAYSSYVSRTCDLPRPDVSIALKNKKPRLTWDAVDGAVSYKIYRSTSKNGTYTLMKTTTGTSYTNTGAKSGKTYYYKVVAVHSKSAANSAYSLVDSIKSK